MPKAIPIPNFSRYVITPDGDIYNLHGKKLSIRIIDGQKTVGLIPDGKRSTVVRLSRFDWLIGRGERVLLPPDALPIPGEEGYYACPNGDIWSTVLDHTGGAAKLAPSPDGHGYLKVLLRRKIVKVHILILRTFHGPKPFPSYEGRHLNDVKLDNRLENLAWGTKFDNTEDRYRNGKLGGNGAPSKGEANGRAVLTERDVIAIRSSALTNLQEARRRGVDPKTIMKIRRRETWAHVP